MVGREVLVPVTLIAKPPEETSVVTVPLVSNLRRVRETTQTIAKRQKSPTIVQSNPPNLSLTNWFGSIDQNLQSK